MSQEDRRVSDSRPPVKHIVSEGTASFLEEWHYALSSAFRPWDVQLTPSPPDIAELESTHFLTSQPCCREKEQESSVTLADRIGRVDRIDHCANFRPREMGGDSGQAPAWNSRYDMGQVLPDYPLPMEIS